LYIYVVIFPPPLSPDGQPEEIEFDGAFAKLVEIATMIGILYLIQYEKRRKNALLADSSMQTK
jgi:hypothetical protein